MHTAKQAYEHDATARGKKGVTTLKKS